VGYGTDMAKFPFTNLHSFKSYIIFVQLFLPDRFPPREGDDANHPWTQDLAFEGLRLGLEMAAAEKGNLPIFVACRKLVDEADIFYRAGLKRDAFFKLEDVIKQLAEIPN